MAGSALIGYTGFVGGTLNRPGQFQTLINSKNIDELRCGRYDLVVCAGVPAVKWLANKEPEADRASIVKLTNALDTIEADEFVLISTIDVYPDPTLEGLDEGSPIDPSVNHAYGANRLRLEEWLRERFSGLRIVRLPALFGDGLKKNVVFDLLNGNETSSVNPASIFQWYPMRRLVGDIEAMRKADIRLLNLFPEPIRTAEILDAFFPAAKVGEWTEPAPHYRIGTKHAIFDGPKGFALSRLEVLGELAAFVAAERRSR